MNKTMITILTISLIMFFGLTGAYCFFDFVTMKSELFGEKFLRILSGISCVGIILVTIKKSPMSMR